MDLDDANTISLPIGDGNIDSITLGGALDYSITPSTSGTYTYNTSYTANTGAMPTSITIDSFNDYSSGISVQEGDLNVHEEGDIKIGNRSLKTFMDTMEKRMAILQPDPRKLEKFEALKKAYEHYKHLEALCEIQEEENDHDGSIDY